MNDESTDSSNDSSSAGSRGWLEKLGRAFGSEPKSREDLLELLRAVSEQGLIEPDTLAMLEGALEVDELQVRDVMIPRSHMVVIPDGTPLDEILPIIIESGHSRFPVVGEDRDQVKGILLAKDLLKLVANGDGLSLEDLVRTPVIIPESKRLNVLLREFRVSKNHMAIVVDEYGGVSGLITIEDVLEEIVGDIDDEHDADAVQDIQKLEEGKYLVQALTAIDDFNESFDSDFSDDEYDTIGGLVVAEFGRLPEAGESVTIDGLTFVVTSADDRRLQAMEVMTD
ncbi:MULTISPECIES: HlyC/CorC family transporter [unclassified Wenzhouxiangella]|uniref:HlyC/CorC family transporter n=1 Tax=unclassified Wenzhouxiangella TaxID=2613841 RepID=UPI000E32BC85|nr:MULTISPECIES: transporter associated domain-containing protein [unclassified Wenzhouxiangella]RFF27760.1 CBS domain-containing protein [Wenzhouxiangella sp. 15181]RFP68389.1 CBS domain-containing protein [Wenzhouxiangella sp. 15190]